MAVTGPTPRWTAVRGSTTQEVARGRRVLRVVVLTALGMALAAFGGLTAAYLLDPRTLDVVDGFAGLWWGSFIAVLVLAVAACVTDTDECEHGDYLGTLVLGLRDEWRRRG